ncbi:hypothetical protein FB382_000337 [Nocardioides ginsengisegetis]|uniref:WD40 repeat domain-containing protein n=1 Tax=Nocardioides ginsengisegetis TaxID=661491 RepID=A0A7W3P854_9ACTN|nr:hypothetical protein [Nocardioides ginsengisegetis]MBA8802046.1 hypothetical protein [Nocardioides ginsengisegetis]
MTTTEIRESLTEVAHAVPAPPIDRLAFERRVRAERRRRTASRGLAAVAAVAAVTVVGSVVHGSAPAPSTPVATAPTGRATDMGTAVTLVENRLTTLVPPQDGGYSDDHTRYEELLGTGPQGAVLVDDESGLVVRHLADDGSLGETTSLADGKPVQRAWVDATGRFVAWVDLGNTLHVRRIGGDTDLETVPLLSQQSQLAATDGTAWVEDEGDRLSYRTPDQSWGVRTQGDPLSARLAADVLAVATYDGTELWWVGDGDAPQPAAHFDGGGALAPDGSFVTPDGHGLAVVRQSSHRVFDTAVIVPLDADLTPVEMSWQDDDRFLVVATSQARTGNHVLLDCSVAARQCTERYDDPTGTLTLGSQDQLTVPDAG